MMQFRRSNSEIILFIKKAEEKLQNRQKKKEFLKAYKTVHHIKFEGAFNGICPT
jgi:hypothetical protein